MQSYVNEERNNIDTYEQIISLKIIKKKMARPTLQRLFCHSI